IRFLQGAFRNLEPSRNDGGFVGSTEYRDAYYASAPDGKLLSKIPSESELLEDSFYDSDPESEFDFSDYSCSETADIVVTMDFSNETLLNSVSTCGERPFEGMNFCHENELIRAADENYFDTCIQE
ncbi:MAG: hypothetical protein KDD64_05695, partial [Bdellovibrionales bacterium]|nr:hypothetical protein [Bdellovibrionales bacterium]